MNTTLTEASATAQALTRHLGDPRDPAGPLSHAAMLALDAREEFPAEAVAALDAWGMGRHYVPAAYGGALRSYEALAGLARAIARHDLTVAVAHAKTFLGVAPLWVGGTEAQRARHGRDVAAGAVVSLALTEEAHGGDLFSTETRAEATSTGYRLTGEKWLINNATRGDALSVLARTDPRGGPRGFSLFFVVKGELSPPCAPLPKIATHGVRGADISGVRFEGCEAPAEARVGPEGHGLELAMKALQVTRSLVPAVSLGALDTALRLVLSFARGRRLGTVTVAEIPHARRVLAETFVELLALDAVVRAGARSVHTAPERLAVTSAVVKSLVPSRVDAALRRLAAVLGARHYLRANPFEKILRDHSLVALFDGSTVVNLHALAQETPRMAARRAAALDDDARGRLRATYDLRSPLPPFRPEALDLAARGDDLVPAALDEALGSLPSAGLDAPVEAALREGVAGLRASRAKSLDVRRERVRPMAQPPEVFTAAEGLARQEGAAMAVLTWVYSRAAQDPYFARGEWLALALAQLTGAPLPPAAGGWYEAAFARLDALHRRDACLALEPYDLATDPSP